MEKEILEIQFVGIDDFCRPVFTPVNKRSVFIGSLDKLFDYDVDTLTVIEYFKDKLDTLVIFGNSFNCEPIGTKINSKFKLVLV